MPLILTEDGEVMAFGEWKSKFDNLLTLMYIKINKEGEVDADQLNACIDALAKRGYSFLGFLDLVRIFIREDYKSHLEKVINYFPSRTNTSAIQVEHMK